MTRIGENLNISKRISDSLEADLYLLNKHSALGCCDIIKIFVILLKALPPQFNNTTRQRILVFGWTY